MLYLLTKYFMRLALRGFFHKIEVMGREHIPAKGPFILVSNHPSALMDPIVIATALSRALHFIAAAEFFGGRFTSRLLSSQFNMIPVLRPGKKATKETDNEDDVSVVSE